jgi:DNA-binding NarL/FixJ family response regulator
MSKPSTWLQHEIFDSSDIRKQKEAAFEEQLSMLPVDPAQNKYNLDRVILTSREFEIMQMVLTGHSIMQIARKIFLSIPGIKFRLSSIYWKFGVTNRLELIKKSCTDSLQFYVEDSPIKQVFHNRLDFKLFESEPANEP